MDSKTHKRIDAELYFQNEESYFLKQYGLDIGPDSILTGFVISWCSILPQIPSYKRNLGSYRELILEIIDDLGKYADLANLKQLIPERVKKSVDDVISCKLQLERALVCLDEDVKPMLAKGTPIPSGHHDEVANLFIREVSANIRYSKGTHKGKIYWSDIRRAAEYYRTRYKYCSLPLKSIADQNVTSLKSKARKFLKNPHVRAASQIFSK